MLCLQRAMRVMSYCAVILCGADCSRGQDPRIFGNVGMEQKALPNESSVDDSSLETLTLELQRMRQRIEFLEQESFDEVDLSEPSTEPSATAPAHVLARRWFENVDVWGFAAFDYLHTGDDGKFPEGGFIIKETTIWAEAAVWDQISTYYEFQVIRLLPGRLDRAPARRDRDRRRGTSRPD